MAENTKIEWCHHTFNPWWGCEKVSEGCKNCYAETFAKRVGRDFSKRVRTKQPWKDLKKWDKSAGKRGVRERVFVGSMMDIGENNPDVDSMRWEALDELADCKNLDVLLLTKRPCNLQILLEAWGFGCNLPDHFWVGTTVENQEMANKRIPELLKVPASVHFLSFEPMLAKIDLSQAYFQYQDGTPMFSHLGDGNYTRWIDLIDWVICGGESGHHARPMHPDWVRSLRDQCKDAGVPFLFKQWGEWAPPENSTSLKNGRTVKCADWFNDSWDITKRRLADTDHVDDEPLLYRVGKSNDDGRRLDGVIHDGYPEVSK